MSRTIVIQFDDEMNLPGVISVNGKSSRTIQMIIESCIERNVVTPVTPRESEYTHIDSPDTQTLTLAYNSPEPIYPPGSLVIVNPSQRALLDALLEQSVILPRVDDDASAALPVSYQNDAQTLRLTTGEGVQDPYVGRLFDIYFKALQQQDYDRLLKLFDPDIGLHSVVDNAGNELAIHGAENVAKIQSTRWDHYIRTYGPTVHRFLITHITRNNAVIAFELPNTDITFYAMYTIENHKISSIRHMKEVPISPSLMIEAST